MQNFAVDFFLGFCCVQHFWHLAYSFVIPAQAGMTVAGTGGQIIFY